MSATADASWQQTGGVSMQPDLAVIGRALGDPSRAAMLAALMSGTAWAVGELASCASVARSTASEHVTHLASAGLVRIHRQGRHTYVTLAGEAVAAALEGLSLIAPDRPVPASLRGQRHSQELADGRTCYRHLAGRLGVQLADHLQARRLVTPGHTLTAQGLEWLAARRVDTSSAGGSPKLRACMDWTERRPHLAGLVATRLTQRAFEEGWIQRGSHPRGVRLTPDGRRHLFQT